MPFDPNTPFDELPLLPPAVDLETKAVLKQCLAATRALAELKGAGGLIPDQAILINSIPLQEARSSSEIENIVTTQDELFRAAADEAGTTDPETKEVLRYRTALREGSERLAHEPLSMNMIRDVCSTLHGTKTEFRSIKEEVYIAGRGGVTYTPPQGGPELLAKLKNLESFLLSADGPDPLIKMAAAHYQFEAIHPFTDGNGRSGRILNILYLQHAKLLEMPVLYLSRYIIQYKPDYYRLLRHVTETGQWEPWMLYMLKGVEEMALWTTGRIRAIRELFDSTVERCRRGELPSIYSKELVEVIFRQPYCRIPFLVEAGFGNRKTAGEYLRLLAGLGILAREPGGREAVYRHPALLEALTG